MSRPACFRHVRADESLAGLVHGVAWGEPWSGGPEVNYSVAVVGVQSLPPVILIGPSAESAVDPGADESEGPCFTPAQARELAALLIRAADVADGLCS